MGPLCKIYLTSPLHQWQENCYGLQRSECNIKNSSRLTHLCEGLPHIRLWTAFIFPLATVILSIPSKGNFVFEIYFCSGVRYRLFMKRFRCALYVGRVRISLNYFIVTWQCVWCYSSHSYVLRAACWTLDCERLTSLHLWCCSFYLLNAWSELNGIG